MNQRPRPVLTAAIITALFNTGLQLLFAFRLIPLDADPDLASIQQAAVTAFVGVISTLVAAIWAQDQVTPTGNPQLESGTQVKVTDARGNVTGSDTVS
jgi:hypothetical protein